jgi:hypothetical protein
MTSNATVPKGEDGPREAARWFKVLSGVLAFLALWLIIMGFGAAVLPDTAGWVALLDLPPAAVLAWLVARRSSTTRAVIASIAGGLVLLGLGGLALISIGQFHSVESQAPRSAPRPTPAPPPPPAPQMALLPEFPWPPPAASASYVLPRILFDKDATVGQVAGAIVSALERKGYVERSFFRTGAGGVALVTRLERINDDGSSFADIERWPAETLRSSTLASFLRGLFYVDPGRYRIIVFILQDLPFAQSPDRVTGDDARAWLRAGANVLPREVAESLFGDGQCTALVYEFASDGTAVRVVESRLTGKEHLEKAGLVLAGSRN